MAHFSEGMEQEQILSIPSQFLHHKKEYVQIIIGQPQKLLHTYPPSTCSVYQNKYTFQNYLGRFLWSLQINKLEVNLQFIFVFKTFTYVELFDVTDTVVKVLRIFVLKNVEKTLLLVPGMSLR